MITGPRFKNDNDHDLQNQQHECYLEVLAVIAERCIQHYEAACRIIGQEPSNPSELFKNIGQVKTSFDHRILQLVHDLMAAYWRWKSGRHELHMPGLEPNSVADWKTWARDEVDDWALYAPEIIRHVVTALAHQNTDQGYEAESMAQEALQDRYAAMLDEL